MTEDDDFLARLRADAAPLRHRPDEVTLARIRARIQERIAPQPTVAELIASWFRPLAAALGAVALVAAIGLATIDVDASVDDVQIAVAGETYVVGH
ncbi:MAG TPA: hypothetical protein VND45_13645 [Thermoanaerobaculia bacterium]|jgi:hypothetical protein|nr:hypothetical protein [Thermoanaerobaculia bacterium]